MLQPATTEKPIRGAILIDDIMRLSKSLVTEATRSAVDVVLIDKNPER